MIDTIGNVAKELLDHINDALSDHTDPPTSVFLAPGVGPPAADDCCPGGGQLYVRPVSIDPSDGTLTPTTTPRNCPLVLAVQFGIGVRRCVHVTEDIGHPPADSDRTFDTLRILRDAAVIQEAITCDWAKDTPYRLWRLDGWEPLPALGGCGGGEWLLTVGVSTCAC